MYKIFRCLLFGGLLGFAACQKESVQNNNINNNTLATTTSTLSYGDTLFYLKNQPGDYTILPVSTPSAPGYFKANPIGLELDSITGKINVTQSETGLRYKVYYLDSAGQRLDSVKLVISGIDYADGIYEIQSTPAAHDTAFPIYNARPGLPLPCSDEEDDDDDDGNDDDDDGCIFDETDLDNDGNEEDVPGVIQDKLLVDVKKGTLDLEASFHAGVFGSSNPANGVTKDLSFYYRLQDASAMALNKITVRLYHFKKRSDIPQWLLDELNTRSDLAVSVNSRTNQTSRLMQSMGASNRLTSFVDFKPKRPPIIIIVSQ